MCSRHTNAYLTAPSLQKDFIICSAEFGLENVGKKALILHALYGGKSSGQDFRNHLCACMQHLGFESCLADPDVWMRLAVTANGTECWEYVLLYTDDALVISPNAEKLLHEGIGRYFPLKEGLVGPPDLYLGGRVRQVVLENSVKAWAFSSSQYVQAAVKNVQENLKKRGERLLAKTETLIQTTYRPKLDVTAELSP